MVKEFEELPLDTNYLFDESMYRYSTLLPQLKLIEQAKKDAWNAAIKWAAENAETIPVTTHHRNEYQRWRLRTGGIRYIYFI